MPRYAAAGIGGNPVRLPAARREGLAALDDNQKRTILLTPLLRLAGALDRGHEQRANRSCAGCETAL
jgi:hypothetical protein